MHFTFEKRKRKEKEIIGINEFLLILIKKFKNPRL